MIRLPLIASLFAAQAATPTLTVGEVAPLAGTRRGVALAGRVLPADLAGRVVEGRVGRVFLPGQVWQLTFLDAPTIVGTDRCERRSHFVDASNPQAPGGEAPANTVLTIGEIGHDTAVAILPVGMAATAARCAAASYISIAQQPERRVAAYRVLNAAMAAARRDATLPFTIMCDAEKPEDCADPRAALAGLPMEALAGIGVSCLDSEKQREGRGPVVIVTCPPIGAGRPYKAEVRFGMSGNDGQSWRLEFVHRPGWPERIALRRTTIIYH